MNNIFLDQLYNMCCIQKYSSYSNVNEKYDDPKDPHQKKTEVAEMYDLGASQNSASAIAYK